MQSLLFSKSKLNKAEAKAWAKKHKPYSSPVEETDKYIRIRQADPEHFSRMRTKSFPGGAGVKVIYGVVK